MIIGIPIIIDFVIVLFTVIVTHSYQCICCDTHVTLWDSSVTKFKEVLYKLQFNIMTYVVYITGQWNKLQVTSTLFWCEHLIHTIHHKRRAQNKKPVPDQRLKIDCLQKNESLQTVCHNLKKITVMTNNHYIPWMHACLHAHTYTLSLTRHIHISTCYTII